MKIQPLKFDKQKAINLLYRVLDYFPFNNQILHSTEFKRNREEFEKIINKFTFGGFYLNLPTFFPNFLCSSRDPLQFLLIYPL